ncbi:GmrSD restriction endonuclease domain-containing protein [Anaerobutyricum soehngenii]|uniref:GmrSD restriction endonuclease domain-containing protein n=1 Tax=Anaerobutyricum soehngenii TaxID=105843 RepID=UPI003D7C0288
MRADNYKITQYSVSSILGYVENSQIAIPEIQRPFVWKGEEVRALIDSLYEGYPIGYLIVWQNSQVRVRNFGKGGTKKILIDGQQRVTALMAALLGKEVLDEQYQSHRIRIAFNPLAGKGEERFAVCDTKHEEDSRWIPDISIFFRRDFSFRQFEKEYKEANPDEDFTLLEESVDTLKEIVKHQVGVIELSFLLDIDVVSEIFIRINLQGKPLNQEDFVMSKISVNEQYGGDYIRNCIDYFCHLLREPSFYQVLQQNETEFFDSEYGKALTWCQNEEQSLYIPSYADVLKVVLISYFGKTRIGDLVHLLSGRDGEKKIFSKKEISKKVSEEAFEKLGAGVKAFVCEENFQGFQKALKKAGYSCSRLLYSQSVLNYCYAMYLLMYRQGIGEKERESLLSKWITMAMITGHYQSGGESTVQKDYANAQEEGFASYLAQIEELKLTDEFYNNILSEKFTSTTARTAPFLAYVATQCARGVHSLYSDVTIEELYKNKTESYQILPKAYLAKCGYKTREIYGQVANLTYISKETKDIIRKKSPVDYKEDLEKAIGIEKIRTSLKENGLAETIFTANETDVIQILDDRRRQMALEIRDFYKTL